MIGRGCVVSRKALRIAQKARDTSWKRQDILCGLADMVPAGEPSVTVSFEALSTHCEKFSGEVHPRRSIIRALQHYVAQGVLVRTDNGRTAPATYTFAALDPNIAKSAYRQVASEKPKSAHSASDNTGDTSHRKTMPSASDTVTSFVTSKSDFLYKERARAVEENFSQKKIIKTAPAEHKTDGPGSAVRGVVHDAAIVLGKPVAQIGMADLSEYFLGMVELALSDAQGDDGLSQDALETSSTPHGKKSAFATGEDLVRRALLGLGAHEVARLFENSTRADFDALMNTTAYIARNAQ